MWSDFGETVNDQNLPILFREKADSARTPGLAENDEKDSEEEHEKVLRCWRCDTEITKDRQRISRDGKHLHTFFNPAGIVYEIGCFRNASGCLLQGTVSNEFSWFRGYTWQICVCIACLEHLGWYFSGGNDGFFGLIVHRLKER